MPLMKGFLKIQPVPEFNKAVAEKFHNDFGVEVNPVTEVIPCNGAGDGFFATLSVLLNPGDEVIYLRSGLYLILSGADLPWEPGSGLFH